MPVVSWKTKYIGAWTTLLRELAGWSSDTVTAWLSSTGFERRLDDQGDSLYHDPPCRFIVETLIRQRITHQLELNDWLTLRDEVLQLLERYEFPSPADIRLLKPRFNALITSRSFALSDIGLQSRETIRPEGNRLPFPMVARTPDTDVPTQSRIAILNRSGQLPYASISAMSTSSTTRAGAGSSPGGAARSSDGDRNPVHLNKNEIRVYA